jgi:hypothetical protein
VSSDVGGSKRPVHRNGVGARSLDGSDEIGKFGFTGVLDVSRVTVAVGSVGDYLDAAIREYHAVRSGGHFTIAALRVIEIIVGCIILDSPGEVVGFRSLENIVSRQ